jgi:predicted nucleic acid-binding protein
VKAFFDTSVLVGAFYGDHPRHAACLRLLEGAANYAERDQTRREHATSRESE